MDAPITLITGVSKGIGRAQAEEMASRGGACPLPPGDWFRGTFLSDHAGFTTGQTLYVCGGLSIGFAPT